MSDHNDRLTRVTLDEHCRRRPDQMSRDQAFEACQALGGMARWVLEPDVLRKAHAGDSRFPDLTDPEWPGLPTDSGACWVIFLKPDAREWPALRLVFALPFRWRPGDHSPFLSDRIKEQAQTAVGAVLAVTDDEKTAEWGLHPHFGLQVDLRGLDDVLKPPSSWAALAAGLILALEDVPPDPRVWASAAWLAGGGIDDVDSLSEKARFAAACGAGMFFVPDTQAWQLQSNPIINSAGQPLEIGSLQKGVLNVRRALDDYTSLLDAEPSRPDPPSVGQSPAFDKCVAYHLRHPMQDRRKIDFNEFYWTHLYPTIRLRCREEFKLPRQATHLVTIVSGSPEVVILVAETIQPDHVLLLYTPNSDPDLDQTKAMKDVKDWLEGTKDKKVTCTPASFTDDDSMFPTIPALVKTFRDRVADTNLVLDLTPGTGLMRWIVDHTVPADSLRVYLRHDTLSAKDRRPKPGTERLVCVPKMKSV